MSAEIGTARAARLACCQNTPKSGTDLTHVVALALATMLVDFQMSKYSKYAILLTWQKSMTYTRESTISAHHLIRGGEARDVQRRARPAGESGKARPRCARGVPYARLAIPAPSPLRDRSEGGRRRGLPLRRVRRRPTPAGTHGPSKMWVATPNRVRRDLGKGVRIVRSDAEPTWIDGVPCQPLAAAIACAAQTMGADRHSRLLPRRCAWDI